jgi:ParB-like chromosome segregation protein Spo0J
MRSNFPEDSIAWVMRTKWTGPVNIPWERIDKDAIDSWAASHQPQTVSRFARDIKAGTGHVNPSVLIQDNDSPKAIIIDGHHRALAHHKLGQPVLAYLGNIDPKDRMAAEETHSKQQHSGTDPQNR